MRHGELALSIAGIGVRIRTAEKTFLSKLQGVYCNFIEKKVFADSYLLKVFCNEFPQETDAIIVEKGNGVYNILTDRCRCYLDRQAREASVDIIPEISHFNRFLRVFYSCILPWHNGFLIHAAAVSDTQQGFLFVGPSSSGKTTTARKAQGLMVLSDELVGLRKIGSRFFLFSSPFNGEFSAPLQNLCVILKSIFFLNKALVGYALIEPQETLIGLLENIFFFDEDLVSTRRLLTLSGELSRTVSAYQINVLARKHLGRFINEISGQKDTPQY